MTLQILLDAWRTSGAYYDVEPPATEAEIQAAEATIGAQLPTSLRGIYSLFNGGWIWDLQLFPLDANPDEELAVTNANELLYWVGMAHPSRDSPVCSHGR